MLMTDFPCAKIGYNQPHVRRAPPNFQGLQHMSLANKSVWFAEARCQPTSFLSQAEQRNWISSFTNTSPKDLGLQANRVFS